MCGKRVYDMKALVKGQMNRGRVSATDEVFENQIVRARRIDSKKQVRGV